METSVRAIALTFFLTMVHQNVFAHDNYYAVPELNCEVDSLAVPNVKNTYYVVESGNVVDLVLRGQSIKSNSAVRNHYLFGRDQDSRVLRGVLSASRTAWRTACPGIWTTDTLPFCVGSVCICFNTGDIVDFTQCGEELVAFCDGVDGCAWRQDGAGNVICTCEDNN